MASSFRYREVREYVRAKRTEHGFPSRKGTCQGWTKHFYAPVEQEVKRAPGYLCDLVTLWWDIRLKLNCPSCTNEERVRLTSLCGEVKDKIDALISEMTSRNSYRGLQLRSNGYFVRVIGSRIYPERREHGPGS